MLLPWAGAGPHNVLAGALTSALVLSRGFAAKSSAVHAPKSSSKKGKASTTDAARGKARAAPKVPRASSAYSMFIKDHASLHMAGGKTAPEAVRELASKWKTLSDAERAPYNARAAEAKATVAAAREAAKANRKPLAPYATFVSETMGALRTEQPGLSAPEYMQMVAVRWKELPQADKERRKQEHSAAVAAWEQRQAGATA